jgi:tight adherence protein B
MNVSSLLQLQGLQQVSVFGAGALLSAYLMLLLSRLSDRGRDLATQRKEEELRRYGAGYTLGQMRRICILGSLAAAVAILLLFSNVVFAIVVLVVGFIIPYLYPWMVRRAYLREFEAGFSECLDIWGRCLQAGLSFQQALEAAHRDMSGPASMEMDRIRKEVSVGDIESAMWNFYARIPQPDVRYAVVGVITCRQTGGRISEVVQKIADAIRERASQRRKIESITSMGRTEAYIMAAMPFLVGGFMYLLQPETMGLLFNTFVGVVGTLIAIAWEALGMAIIWKIVNIEE